MDKATEEKRNLNADEGKQFDELRARAESLDTDISRLEVLADEERNQLRFRQVVAGKQPDFPVRRERIADAGNVSGR
ncbi:hypothetical protein [Erwinia tracheiphila]